MLNFLLDKNGNVAIFRREVFVKRLFGVIWIVLVLATSALAQASGFVEQENVVQQGRSTPWVNVYAKGALTEKFGWTIWAQTARVWGETLGGLTFAPEKHIELSAMAGIETDHDPLRYSASVWLGHGRFSFLTIQESGGSGYWQKNVGVVRVKKMLDVGIYQQQFVGTGPYAKVNLGSKVSIWGMYAPHEKNGIATARFNF